MTDTPGTPLAFLLLVPEISDRSADGIVWDLQKAVADLLDRHDPDLDFRAWLTFEPEGAAALAAATGYDVLARYVPAPARAPLACLGCGTTGQPYLDGGWCTGCCLKETPDCGTCLDYEQETNR